jgi:hypothetical protein
LLYNNDKLDENKNSLIISYSRTINIIFGYYPYLEKIHNIILEIKNNLNPKMKNYQCKRRYDRLEILFIKKDI